jgi:4-aminobutyrate aminotransferase-like enzyme
MPELYTINRMDVCLGSRVCEFASPRSVAATNPPTIVNTTVAEALADGILINSPQPDALRFMPALNVTREEISLMIDCLDAILVKAGAARRVA